jgi:hypothetical protein
VADAGFLTNGQLGAYEHAPFLLDLALAYGGPSFDERCHGLSVPHSPWVALGASFLLLVGISLAMLTLAALLSARRWPVRGRASDVASVPTLEVFVGSLASLYRARGQADPAAVFAAYRGGYVRRLQRALFGLRELSLGRFEERLEAEARALGPAGRFLAGRAKPGSTAELTRAVSSLERYAASTMQRKRKR